jgi:hypothetical protein
MLESVKKKSGELALLALILLGALAARLGHSHQGLPYLHHPDEPHTSVVALEMMKTGDLNPHRFNYGSLNIYMMLAVDAAHYIWLCRSPDEVTGKIVTLESVESQVIPNWRWETSHPSFYLWNRGLCALLGTLTCLLLYLIGRRTSPIVGLTSAAILAALSVHIENSAMVAPDIPVAFFVLLTVTLCSAYMESGRTVTLFWAFAATGLALATKYNVVPLVLVPYSVLAISRRKHAVRPHWLWWGGALTTMGTFLLCMPYALLDLPLFLTNVGFEVSHYSIMGHGPNTVGRGLPHFAWAIEQLSESLSIPGLALAAGGLMVALTNRKLLPLFIFPIVFLFMQTQMVVGFHRNLIVLYPFLALAIGLSAQQLVTWCASKRPSARPAILAFMVALLAGLLLTQLHEAREIFFSQETRTTAAKEVARLARERQWKKVGIARSLRIHPIDLAHIDAEVVVDTTAGLRTLEGQLDAIVCPTEFEPIGPEAGIQSRRIANLKKGIPPGEATWHIPGGPCLLSGISINPGVQIFAAPFSPKVQK